MPPTVSRHLPGEWEATGTLMGTSITPTILFFEESGDLKRSEELFGDRFDAIRRATWRVDRQRVLVSLEYGRGASIEFVLPVVANECNKMVIGEEGILYLELSKPARPRP